MRIAYTKAARPGVVTSRPHLTTTPAVKEQGVMAVAQSNPAISKPQRRSFPSNLAGMQFGHLVALAPYTNGRWIFKCVRCCNFHVAWRGNVLKGDTQSCGCLQSEMKSIHRRTHGATNTPEYLSWMAMKARCTNRNSRKYHLYGGRGICVCEQWGKFENFIADMGLKPTPKHTIDRINNDGNYEPGNCRWATNQEQSRNRSTNKFVDVGGQMITIGQLAAENNLNYSTLKHRINAGWTVADAISVTPHPGNRRARNRAGT